MAEELSTMKGRTTGMVRTKQDPLTPPTPWGKLHLTHVAAIIHSEHVDDAGQDLFVHCLEI